MNKRSRGWHYAFRVRFGKSWPVVKYLLQKPFIYKTKEDIKQLI